MSKDSLRLPIGPMLAQAAAAALITLSPPSNPRFIEMPFRDHKPMAWRGRARKTNPNAGKQAAAKRARKITRKRP